MKRLTPCLAAAGLLLSAVAGFADPASSSNDVFVGGTPIMRVRVAAGGYTPDQRASEIQQRVNDALSHGPVLADDITVEPVGNEDVVRVKGDLLFTADWATARYNDATPLDLANQWADRMRMVLPKLTEAK